MFPVKNLVINATVKIPILYAFKNLLCLQEFLERHVIVRNGKGLEDARTHRSLGALDLSLDIISESEVFFRIANIARDIQIWLCREHRIYDHMFNRFGYQFSI